VRRDVLSNTREGERALADLRTKRLNFDPQAVDPDAPEGGWRIDDYRQDLPREEPGPPVDGGSWRTACALLRDYEFVDPSIVRALYRADVPLEGRDMLLELRIWGLRFHVGVRVCEVSTGTVDEDGRRAAIWGWSYATLEGHFEAGRMNYEVRKWLDTGEVDFRIYAYSRTAPIANPVVRLGFKLLGRRKQTQFARHACERMRRFTELELERGGRALSKEEAARADGASGARGRLGSKPEDSDRLDGTRTSGSLVVRPTAAR
jgi:uncharacterized protein (UPF0548 family)